MGFLLLGLIQLIMVEPGLELGQSDTGARTLNLTVLSTFPNILRKPVHYPHPPLSSTHVPPFGHRLQKDSFLLDPKRDIQTW